jgi:hypothetical protein
MSLEDIYNRYHGYVRRKKGKCGSLWHSTTRHPISIKKKPPGTLTLKKIISITLQIKNEARSDVKIFTEIN